MPAENKSAVPAAEFDPDSRLLRLAQPVLDRLADEVANADMTVILTDPRGLVLDRRAGSASLLRGLDRVFLSPGHLYAEDAVGTNGIGTAAEDREAAWVVGSEHYAEWLRWLSCAGVPIRHPITGRVEGILDLTCRIRHTSSLMVPFVKEGARQIGQRLYEEASHADRELLERFVAASRRSSRPVVAVNRQTVISNAAAARILEPGDHTLLWNRIAEALAGGTRTLADVHLSQGVDATVRCISFDPDQLEQGAVLEIEVDSPHAAALPRLPAQARNRAAPYPPGRSPGWRRVCEAAADLARTRLPLVITGEPGAGKATLAHYLYEQSQEEGPFTELDCALTGVEGSTAWLRTVRSRLADRPGILLLRHLEALDTATARVLSAMLAATEGEAGPRIVATLSLARDEAPAEDSSLLDRFAAVVHIPPLRERAEDIADILPALIRRHSTGPRPHCSSDVIQVLMRADWPGNVLQLESLVKRMLARRRFGELTLRDLPPQYQPAPWRRLTAMEQAERAAILRALADTDGNKSRAAGILGISRVTLYRKLKELGISEG